MVYASVGGILAIIQLLTIVLVCCYANALARENEDFEYEEEICYNTNTTNSRPGTPMSTRRKPDTAC